MLPKLYVIENPIEDADYFEPKYIKRLWLLKNIGMNLKFFGSLEFYLDELYEKSVKEAIILKDTGFRGFVVIYLE